MCHRSLIHNQTIAEAQVLTLYEPITKSSHINYQQIFNTMRNNGTWKIKNEIH